MIDPIRARRAAGLVAALGALLAAEAGADLADVAAAPQRSVELRGHLETRLLPHTDFGSTDAVVTRAALGARANLTLESGAQLRVSLSTSVSHYDFDDDSPILGVARATSDPFDPLLATRLRLASQLPIAGSWSLVGGGFASGRWEEGASFGDGLKGGGFAGFAYERDDRLRVALGAQLSTRIARSGLGVSPFLLLHWRITDALSFETHGRGARLRWRLDRKLQLFAGGEFESRRYRLASRSGIGSGTLQERIVPLGAGLIWRPHPRWRLVLDAGATVHHRLRVEDDDRDEIGTERADPAPYAGLRVELSL